MDLLSRIIPIDSANVVRRFGRREGERKREIGLVDQQARKLDAFARRAYSFVSLLS